MARVSSCSRSGAGPSVSRCCGWATTSSTWRRSPRKRLGPDHLASLARVIPAPTQRLRFRCMEDSDLDRMADLLGDPEVMRHYPRPKTRDEALGWIRWNQKSYS